MATQSVLRISGGVPMGNGGATFKLLIGLEPPNPPPRGDSHQKLMLLRAFLEDETETKKREFIEAFPEERHFLSALEALIQGCEGECLMMNISDLEVSLPAGEQFAIEMLFEA